MWSSDGNKKLLEKPKILDQSQILASLTNSKRHEQNS